MNKTKKILLITGGSVAALLLIVTILFTTTGPSLDELRSFAKQGVINQAAPVQDKQVITINAPTSKVWDTLSSVKNWPSWQSDIKSVKLETEIKPGGHFTWDNAGSEISSELVSVNPNKELSWIGTTFGAKAVHIWKLQPLSNDPFKTQVTVDESLDGFLIQQLYGTNQLHDSLERWLQALKIASEK